MSPIGTRCGPSGVASVALAVILVAAAPAGAQEEVVEDPPKPWGNEAEASFVMTGGNSSSQTFAVSDRFFYNWTYSELIVRVGALRAESDTRRLLNVDGVVVEETISEVRAESYDVEGRFRRNVLDELFWFVGGGWHRDEFSGIDSRVEGIAGAGYRFVENSRGTVVGELGGGVTRENRVNGISDTIADVRGRLSAEWQVIDTTHLASTLEVIGNVQDFGDHRILSESSISVRINDHLALRAAYGLKFDNEPVVILVDTLPGPPAPFTLEKTDTRLSTSLVIKF